MNGPTLKQRNPPVVISAQMAALIATLLVLTGCYCVRLWPEWSQNPDLSHGFFAPIIFILLLLESSRHGEQRWLPVRRWTAWAIAGFATAGFIFFALAGLLAASVAWTHALVLFVLGICLCCFLYSGLLILADERVRLLPLNWISFTAIFLWLLVAPLPNGTYARLTLSLQTGVTGAVFHTLHLLGIPAQQHGNMIELPATTVGVEEACSGIRSLLSCIYAGFFFAAWQVRRPINRWMLIGMAPLLALVMNFIRSLLLTLMANAGKDITGIWHDATGYAILTVTSALLAWLATALETHQKKNPTPRPIIPRLASPRGPLCFFWIAVTACVALGTFYFVHSRPADSDKRIPNLAALLPLHANGWQVSTTTDLFRFSNVLQTTNLIERTYVHPSENGQLVQFTVYLAYWPAGQATVSRVASHTPDACWPGSGWIAKPSGEPRQVLSLPHAQLFPAEHRFFQNNGFPQHVWFWHIYDGRPINYRDPYSVSALLELALRYGFRNQGDQSFIRISSNCSWSEISSEPLVGKIVSNLDQLGL